jgi:hypothetical protein
VRRRKKMAVKGRCDETGEREDEGTDDVCTTTTPSRERGEGKERKRNDEREADKRRAVLAKSGGCNCGEGRRCSDEARGETEDDGLRGIVAREKGSRRKEEERDDEENDDVPHCSFPPSTHACGLRATDALMNCTHRCQSTSGGSSWTHTAAKGGKAKKKAQATLAVPPNAHRVVKAISSLVSGRSVSPEGLEAAKGRKTTNRRGGDRRLAP